MRKLNFLYSFTFLFFIFYFFIIIIFLFLSILHFIFSNFSIILTKQILKLWHARLSYVSISNVMLFMFRGLLGTFLLVILIVCYVNLVSKLYAF